MPFTPFHLGPGLLIKAAAPRHFSFLAYTASQVAIDLESGYFLATSQAPVHRTLHTFAVGAVVGLVTGVATAWIARRAVPAWRTSQDPRIRSEVGTRAGLYGGLSGGVLHSLFDGIMHRDIMPFRPFTSDNPLLGLVGLEVLHWGCLAAGAIGALWLSWPGERARRSYES